MNTTETRNPVHAEASERGAPQQRATVFAVVLATTIAQVASVMGIAVFPVIAPRLAADMGIAASAIGYQMSLVYGAATVSSPLMSFSAARWGACRTTQAGLVLCAIAMALALTSHIVALVFASLLLGVALGIMLPAAAHLLFRFSPPKNRNLIFSIKQTGVPLAWVIMALAAPSVTIAFGWRWALVAVLAVSLAIAAALERVRASWDDDRSPRANARARPMRDIRVMWRYPILRWLSLSSFCLSFVQLCLGTFAVTMLVEEAGYTLVSAGVMLSIVQAAGVGGRVIWGWIADRTGDSFGVLQKLALASSACCAAVAFVGPAWPPLAVALLFVPFGAAAVGWNGVFLAEIARSSPRGMVSAATAGAMVLNFGGVLLGPAAFATLYQVTGSYRLTYGWLTLVALAGLAFITYSGTAARRRITA